VCSSKVLAIAGRGAACRRGPARVGTQVAGVITSSPAWYVETDLHAYMYAAALLLQ